MKPYIRTVVFAATFVAASLTQTLHAQAAGTKLEVKVPFAFNCGGQHFGPGTYTLDMRRIDVLLVTNGSSSGLAITETGYSLVPAKTGRAVFKKYGDHYFLDEIWMPGTTMHISVNERKWEKQAAMQLAADGRQSAQVELALLDVSNPTNR